MTIANQAVEMLVRPELVMQAMNCGEFNPIAWPDQSETSGKKAEKPEWTLVRKGADKVIVYRITDSAQTVERNIGFIFERDGLLSWKVTEIRFARSD